MIDLAIAVVIGVMIMAVALWTIRLLATPPPPEPDPNELVDVEVTYQCSVCGMQLTVTYAQDADPKPPRHCREEMVLVAPITGP